jgi:hypothetical protein
VLPSESVFAGGNSIPGQHFRFLELALLAKGSSQIFHHGEGIGMVLTQGAASGLHAATKEVFSLRIATGLQLERGIVVEG